MNYSERYENTIAALARPLEPEDGVPEEEIAAAEERLGIRLPAALREFYLIAGQFDQFNLAHNRLYTPEEWEVRDGKLIFMEENQVVVVWAVEGNSALEDDPPVWQGVPLEGQPMEWNIEHTLCSEFLNLMLYLQGVFGGMEGSSEDFIEISEDALDILRAEWNFIGQSGEMLVFGGDGRALCVLGTGVSRELYIGGRTQEDFDALETSLADLLDLEDEDEEDED